jgi:tetratricopeptide (TPR) repeat protein
MPNALAVMLAAEGWAARVERRLEIRLFPDTEYTFKHALTHEVAYGGLLNDQRKALHARVLAAIEVRSTTSLQDQAERLVHHAVRAGEGGKAARYGYWAGRRAAARCAYRDAVTYYDQALDAATRLPDGREALELGIDIRASLRRALVPLGQAPAAFARLSEAAELARKLGDPGRLMSSMVAMTHLEMRAYRVSGAISRDLEEAADWYGRGIALAQELGARPEIAHCHAGLATLYRRTGREQEAGKHFTTATAMYREMGMTFWLEKAEAEMQSLA